MGTDIIDNRKCTFIVVFVKNLSSSGHLVEKKQSRHSNPSLVHQQYHGTNSTSLGSPPNVL